MVDQISNDNDMASAEVRHGGPDAYGQAAMLLVESLIHGLIERSVIRLEDAVAIVGVAAEVKEEIAVDMGDTPATMHKSIAILNAIETSLRNDLPAD